MAKTKYKKVANAEIRAAKTFLNKKGLTTFEATQTLISCIIGCVLVSVPYSMTMTGYLNGIIINFLVLSIIMFATHLYLQASEIFKIR